MKSNYCIFCILLICLLGIVNATDDFHQFNRRRCCGPSCTKNVYLSVVIPDRNRTECGLRVEDVPLYGTLYEAMLFAEQQYPPSKFSFTTSFNEKYGHFIESIVGVRGANPFFWCVFDRRGVPLPVGVDFTYPYNHEAYIWSYQNTTDTHCASYSGPCTWSDDDEKSTLKLTLKDNEE
ncbi:uncharacterized protein [Amphiura filiformis]|uniref:uncharacterized protein n=1 Tax=Amphiura filiformis TaxID=82378 RepID=UPI003B21886E